MTMYKIKEGGITEFNEWYIKTDCKCVEDIDEECCHDRIKPCKHCINIEEKTEVDEDGYVNKTMHWICPRTVIARNEGGYNGTQVCLDCIIEAKNLLDEGKLEEVE